jgi:hypothetical protein
MLWRAARLHLICMTARARARAPRQARSYAVQIADLMSFFAAIAKTGNTTAPVMLYEMIGVVRHPSKYTATIEVLTAPGPARPPLRSERVPSSLHHHLLLPLTSTHQNRQNRRQDRAREERGSSRCHKLGHFPPPQACEKAAVHTSRRPPLYYALRCESEDTARLETDDEFGPEDD